MVDLFPCSGCGKTPPHDWCWDGRDYDCPLGVPPRWAIESSATRKLWEEVRRLRHAVDELSGVQEADTD